MQDVVPLLVFGGMVLFIWAILSMISQRNSRATERLSRISRPASLVNMEDPATMKKERFQGVMETAKALSAPLMPQTELEQSALRIRLANAGLRHDSAGPGYLGLRSGALCRFFIIGRAGFRPQFGIPTQT